MQPPGEANIFLFLPSYGGWGCGGDPAPRANATLGGRPADTHLRCIPGPGHHAKEGSGLRTAASPTTGGPGGPGAPASWALGRCTDPPPGPEPLTVEGGLPLHLPPLHPKVTVWMPAGQVSTRTLPAPSAFLPPQRSALLHPRGERALSPQPPTPRVSAPLTPRIQAGGEPRRETWGPSLPPALIRAGDAHGTKPMMGSCEVSSQRPCGRSPHETRAQA